MNNLKELVEDFVEYTRNWSISESEWYYNVNDTRKTQDVKVDRDYISQEEFERAIREDILYCFIYDIDSIKNQMEIDLQYGYDEDKFIKISKYMEKKIQKIFKDFKIER